MRRLGFTLLAAAGLLVALVIASAGPAGGTSGTTRPAAVSSPCDGPSGVTRGLAVAMPGGDRRTALVHRPAGVRGPAPLVIALHGAGHNGAFMERYSALSKLADRQGFAVAYPDASSSMRHFWTLRPGHGPDDLGFISALIDRFVAAGCIDADRVSVVGVSNGGGLAALLGCEASGRLAAVVAVAGGYGDLPECRADRPVSVLEIHGTADSVVPYHAQRGDVLEWLGAWAARDGCKATARRSAVVRNVTRMEWPGCASATRVEHFAIRGGEHAWPGADPPDPGPRVDLSATQEAWRFLKTRRRVTQAGPAR